MRDLIKEMTEIAKELNKLLDQLIKLAWKISSLVGVILFIIYSLKQRERGESPIPLLKNNTYPQGIQYEGIKKFIF